MSPDIKAALSAPLDRKHVLTRSQSGRSLSYIEGWHAIAEANRIFGFDGWTRETVDTRCVAERARKIGQAGRDGWGVTYIAKVRVTALGVVREGTGTGHGIDADLGAAHESAIKEAETDAMKRALMTFGNPFGLALYDKKQENVADAPKLSVASLDEYEAPGEPDPFPGDPGPRKSAHSLRKDQPERWSEIVTALRSCVNVEDMRDYAEAVRDETSKWPDGWLKELRAVYRDHADSLTARAA